MRKWQPVVAVVSLMLAAAAMAFAYVQYDRVVATTPIVVPAEVIEPYTVITASMLEMREMPRPLADEPIYVNRGELVGKIATQKLLPGQLIYRHQAVEPRSFRLTDDPYLAVVSFPADPAKAVGGQIRIGHRIDIYRVAKGARPHVEDVAQLLKAKGAEAELLAEGVQVVDVRTRRGEKAGEVQVRRASASSGRGGYASSSETRPLQIITVAVPREVAEEIVELAVEAEGSYELWVVLSPAVEQEARK